MRHIHSDKTKGDILYNGLQKSNFNKFVSNLDIDANTLDS